MIRDLPIDQIDARSDARQIDEATVGGLVDSIGTVGLINPIRVRAIGDRWEVIAGRHRLAACTRLGLAEITADIIDADDLHAELAMIDENLCRAELSPVDRAMQTARRKAIYLELHPETDHGGNATGPSGQFVHTESASFAAETAKAIGKDERTVRRDAERGEKIIPEVMEMIRDTPLETGVYMDRIKKYPPNDQFAIATRDLADLKRKEREANQAKKAAKVQADIKTRAAREVAEIIAEHIPGEWWDAVKSNLYAAGAKNIADALTNITGEAIMDRSAA